MAGQTWQTLVNAYQVSGANTGTAYNTSEALTDVSPGGKAEGALLIPANYLQPGTILRYTASGQYGTTGTPKLTLGVYYGGIAGKALCSAISTCPTTKKRMWRLEATSRVSNIVAGEKAKVFTQGLIWGTTIVATEAVAASVITMPIGEEATVGNEVEVNLNKAEILTLGAKWSANSAENTLTVTQWLVEILN